MSSREAAFVESLVILVALSAAGVVHALWMRSAWSHRFDFPLDGGATYRGLRIFGDNKTVRGFMAIVPAAGAAFWLLGLVRDAGLVWLQPGLWGLRPSELLGLGLWAGFGFMAGELPNSFYKRQRGIRAGEVPARGWERTFCLIVDRLDSTLAVLCAMSLIVGLHWQTWVAVMVLGPLVHLAFSGLLYAFGVKARFA